MIRLATESFASTLFGHFRKRIRLARGSNELLCVNLGSAHRAPRNWLNLDRSANVLIDRIPGLAAALYAVRLLPKEQFDNFRTGRWRAVHFWDARYPIPVSTATTDYIYTSHFLEHLTVGTADRVLQECFRILKPGGIIRLVVPDLYLISQQYVSVIQGLETLGRSRPDTVLYLTTQIRVDELSESFAAQFFEKTLERQRLFGHRWMYDKWSLRRALERVGFTGVTEKPYQQGSPPDLKDLDCRPSNSLHMEARKPARTN